MSCFKFFSSFLFFCIVLFTAWAKSAFPQNSFSELEASEIYSAELNIVNGGKWYYENKFKGDPFFNDNGFTEGNVLFRGEIFSNMTLAYDLFINELILSKNVDNENKKLILNKEFVERFTLKNTDNYDEYTFVRKNLPGVEGIKYYHVVYNGTTPCFIYHKKDINNRVTGNYMAEYLYKPVIYIKRGEEFRDCKNKKSFLRLLEDQKESLRKYIRKNNLSIDGKNPQHIALVLEYYDSLAQ